MAGPEGPSRVPRSLGEKYESGFGAGDGKAFADTPPFSSAGSHPTVDLRARRRALESARDRHATWRREDAQRGRCRAASVQPGHPEPDAGACSGPGRHVRQPVLVGRDAEVPGGRGLRPAPHRRPRATGVAPEHRVSRAALRRWLAENPTASAAANGGPGAAADVGGHFPAVLDVRQGNVRYRSDRPQRGRARER